MLRIIFSAALLILIGCDTDKMLTVRNSDPEVWITSHNSTDEFIVGVSTVFFGAASDANHQESDLVTNWYANNRELCIGVIPEIDGTTVCEASFEEGDDVLRLQVVDPLGATAFDELPLNLITFTDPEVTLSSPVSSETYYEDVPIAFRADISDALNTPSELMVAWSSSQDGVLDISEVDSSGHIEDFQFLTEGTHIISLEVTNEGGKKTDVSRSIVVRSANQPPTCSISLPADGSAFLAGFLLTLQAQVADPDVDASYLQTSWTSDQDGLLGSGVFSNGVLVLTTNALSAAVHNISLTVEDEQGLRCTDSIQISIGTPPHVSITSPSSGSVWNLGETINFTGQVQDNEDAPSQLEVRWSSDVGGDFAQDYPSGSGLSSVSYNGFVAGNHVITMLVTDPSGFSGSDDISIYINTPPEAPQISLSPSAPSSIEDLQVSVVSSSDIDGDTLSYSYVWYKNGTITSHTTATIASSNTSVGETWMVEVRAFDGYTEGSATTASVVIQNTAPDISIPVISPSTVYNDSTLTCSATATDLDQVVSISYAWNVGGQTFVGATLDLSTLSISPTTEVICIAQTIDAQQAVDTESTSIIVTNRPPQLVSHGIIPNVAYVGAELVCNALFSEPDGESLNIVYEWSVQNTVVGNASTLVVEESFGQAGNMITCFATVEDGYGEVVSSQAFAIVQSVPSFDVAATITPSTGVYTGSQVTCSALASDAEDGLVNVLYSWQVNGAEIATGTSYTVQSSDVGVGQSLTCVASATDMDLNTVTSTASVVIQNTAPQISFVNINPTPLYNDSVATCSSVVLDVDESIVPTYQWSIDGQNLGSGTTFPLNSGLIAPSEELVCTATAQDASGALATLSTSSVVSNRLPTAPQISISPSSPELGVDDLLCSIDVDSTDADDDSISYVYVWSLDGNPLPSYTTDTIPASVWDQSQEWTCTVIPFDGNEDGASASATLNTPEPCANTACDLTVYFPDGTGVDFVEIPAGTFLMGSPVGENGRESLKETQHEVTLTNDFYMMTTEMNQAMFSSLMGYNPSFISCGVECAIEKISWHEAVYFSNLLTEYANGYLGMNMEQCYSCTGTTTTAYCTEAVAPIYDCTGFRLPTEAEWEYASRAGVDSAFHTGGNPPTNLQSFDFTSCPGSLILDNGTDVSTISWHCGNNNTDSSGVDVPSPIALTLPNAWGLYDMHGNVREWCNDWYAQNYGGTTGTITDPLGATTSTSRVIKGGSWDQDIRKLRSGARSFAPPTNNLQSFGFRVAKTK